MVKFRDIAMRGPWTSGGIEFNFGIIGHAPTTSTTVDYLTKKKSDGSVSCYISSFDIITRTFWTVEVIYLKIKLISLRKQHGIIVRRLTNLIISG